MSRGPVPHQTLSDAIPIAMCRGTVQMIERGPEALFDFMIAQAKPVAVVSVKYAEFIRAVLADIARDYDADIRRLRSVTQDAAPSCELWLRSRYGTWRFFRVTADALIEIGRDGQPLGVKA
jgi:hypothetical protein